MLKNNARYAAFSLDLIVSVFASLLAVLFIRWCTEPVIEYTHILYSWVGYAAIASATGILTMRTHRIVIKHSTITSVGKLVTAAHIKEALMVVVILLKLFSFDNSVRLEILLLLVDLLLTMVLLVLSRVIIMAIYNEMKENPEDNVNRVPVMVYGTSDKSVAMVVRLEHSPHYEVIGYLTRDKGRDGLYSQDCKAYWFSDSDSLDKLRTEIGFVGVIFANEEEAERENCDGGLVQQCFQLGLSCLGAPKIDNIDLGGVPMASASSLVKSAIEYIPDGMSAFERNTKRTVDLIASTVLIVIFSPLFLICYIAIKLDDHGPAIYKQERIGRFGRPFFIYKFRSMRTDAESSGPALFSGDDDPRLTKVGKFLRLHHLDELPQLFNVWMGDMAFIGYRPERKFYIDQIMEHDPRYYFLYQIRPGVTSYSTLKNGYTDTMEKMLRRLEFDLYYLRHRSWWFDIKILWQTFANIIFGKVF